MSHISQAQTKIKFDLSITPLEEAYRQLRAAVQAVSSMYSPHQEHDAGTDLTTELSVTNFIYNWSLKPLPCEVGLFVDGLERGMAVKISPEGGVYFEGDFYGRRELATKLQGEILQMHTALAMQGVLQSLGYVMNAEQDAHGKLVLRGVKY